MKLQKLGKPKIQNTTKPSKKEPDKPKPEKKQRKNAIGGDGKKICLHPGDALKNYPKLVELLEKQNLPGVTLSYVVREGARQFIDKLMADATKASKGELHAKKRK